MASHTQPTDLNPRRLFIIGVLALFTAAVSFSMRAAIAGSVKTQVLDPLDPLHSGELIGAALGVAFLGFAIALLVTSPILNAIGMGRLLRIAAGCFISGSLLIAGCTSIPQIAEPYQLLWLGMLLSGVAWGCTESAINPMTAVIYPNDKTHRMNVLHAWWPAGLIVGGLLGFALGEAGVDWRILILITVIPAVVFFLMSLGEKFPQTESAALGVSTSEMLSEIVRRPSFFIWFGLMFLTAATELAPGQWVDLALSQVVGMRGILLLVFVSGLMFVMRHFAGPIAHALSPVGLLWVSSALALMGLWLLSSASNPILAIIAAAFWGTGVCFMWPTMLAVAAERYPRGGAWTIGLMGFAGALSIYLILPKLGKIYDQAKISAAGGADRLAQLQGTELNGVLAQAASESFRTVALFPIALLVAFGLIWIVQHYNKRKA
jgi:MFS family permease